MKKIIASLALTFAISHNAHADVIMGAAAAIMAQQISGDITKLDDEPNNKPDNTVSGLDSYITLIIGIQSALTQYNRQTFPPSNKPIGFFDLGYHKVLNMDHHFAKLINPKDSTILNVKNISVNLKTIDNKKINLLLENASEEQCRSIVTGLKNNLGRDKYFYKHIHLNSKLVDEKNDYKCGEKNSIAVINY